MLELVIKDKELFDSEKEEFVNIKGVTLQLEHSLLSIKKWESKWRKSFLNRKDKTLEEIKDYIRCMTLNKSYVDPKVYDYLSADDIKKVVEYIEDPMTATVINSINSLEKGGPIKGKNDVVTAELIYYWMIACNIPPEYQKWHLNQLLTLIRVVNSKNAPDKKVNSKQSAMARQAENARRRALHRSKG